MALLLVTVIWLIVTAPLSRALEPLDDPAMLLVSAEGRPIARRGAVKDEPVDAAELDPLTPAAFISIEDRRFRTHWGIDPRAIGRAMVANFQAGGVRQGGSTIAATGKNQLSSADRSLKRKAQEVIIAFWLEGWLTKDEILSRYLSSVYFGDGVYGLRAASRHYFDREPERLTLAQSAMLAGMVQAPSRLAPTKNLALAQKRAGSCCKRWPTPARSARLGRKQPVRTASGFNQQRSDRHLFRRLGGPSGGPGVRCRLWRSERCQLTLDADLQRMAVRAVANARIGDAQAALVAMRPNGRVVAMVGGRNYGKSPFNRATWLAASQAAHSSCSSTSRRSGPDTPDSMIEDRPVTVDGWSPGNNDGVYRGTISLREAFARSSNAATVRLAEQVGRQNIIRAAKDPGVDSPLTDRPSLSLGTSGVSLLELTAAYAAIAGGLYPVEPRGLRLDDEDVGLSGFFARGGHLDDRRDRAPMLQLLWAAANRGTGRRAAISTPTFGKTGTTQNNRDALFVGFARESWSGSG